MSLPARIVKRKNHKGYWTYWYDKRSGRKWKKLDNSMALSRILLEKLREKLINHTRDYSLITLENYYKIYKKDYLYEKSSRSWSGKQRLHIESYILPAFKKKNLQDFSLYDVEAWYKKLCKNHPRKYANHIAGTLKRMLKRAEGKYIQRSPISNLKLLTPERKLPDHFSREEIKTILKKLDGRNRALIILWLHTGLRPGEMQHLQVKDIDLASKKVYIRSKPEHRIKDCEDRTIDLTQQAIENILILINDKSGNDYVFPSPTGSYYKNLGQRVGKILKKIKHRGNANLLRHTFASLFLSGGGNLAELKQYMGHSSILTTERHYAAFIPGKKSSIHSIDFET